MATRSQSRRRGPIDARGPAALQPLENRQLMSAVVATPDTAGALLSADAAGSTVAGLTPAQVRHAYGFDTLTFNGGKTAATGAGQTIAIVDAYNDPDIAADLSTFDAKFGLAAANLTVVGQTGSKTSLPATDAGWGEEISLDVEWAHAVAPGAKLLLVEANSADTTDLLSAVEYARSYAGVAAVSMSWGSSEFRGETGYDADFTTPAGHAGVTFVTASGDDGSGDGAEWPSSSAYVLSVGGTSLTTTGSAGTYSSETGWADGGGGKSEYEGEPSYQSKVQSADVREVPDVSYDADPETGFAVYDSLAYERSSGWLEFGGTSAAAPQWAALVTVADQGRVAAGKAALDGATNLLPTLYGLESSSTTYAADFHDVTSGSSSRSVSAGTGYDMVTGIGTPKATSLIDALVASTTGYAVSLTSLPVATSPTRGGPGGGPGGGGPGGGGRGPGRGFVAVADGPAASSFEADTASAQAAVLTAPQFYQIALSVNAGNSAETTAATPAAADVTAAATGGAAATAAPTAGQFADAAAAPTLLPTLVALPAAAAVPAAALDTSVAIDLGGVTPAAALAASSPPLASDVGLSNRTLGTAAGVLVGGVAFAAWASAEFARKPKDEAAASPFGNRLIRLADWA